MRPAPMVCLGLAGTLAVAALTDARASAPATAMATVPHAWPMLVQPRRPGSPVPAESVASLRGVSICPASGCWTHAICPTDSIAVRLEVGLPNDCFRVRGVDLYYPPILPLPPIAPIVRVLVDDGGCLTRPCVASPIDWNGSITLPPLPAGHHTLDIAVVTVACTDTFPSAPWPRTSFPLRVYAICDGLVPATGPHLWGGWVHPAGAGVCDATLAPGGSATATFTVVSDVALSGLRGYFRLTPNALRIVDLEPAGAAAGMHVTWENSGGWVRFTMSAEPSASIPPIPGLARVPVLAVTVSSGAGRVPGETEIVTAGLVGIDRDGGLARVPTIAFDCYSYDTFCDVARVCAVPDCDFNSDGLDDVRDLVLMVRCLQPFRHCARTFDCDQDSSFSMGDVPCCAWRALRAKPCAPPESCAAGTAPPRNDPAVRVSVGAPVEDGDGVRVLIHIDGADHIGAARLAMRFPSDRWSIVGLDSDDPAWLTLVGEDQGEAVMGAIRTSPETGATTLNLTLRLRPVGGALAGGELGALQVDVSAMDGVKLIVPVSGPARPLPGSPTLDLSENRPDPFSGETRFTLSLPAASAVDLGVFDLSGRRVATLHRGALKAGVSEFAWGGRMDQVGRARGGVYFYRVAVSGQAVSRRMVYLGGR